MSDMLEHYNQLWFSHINAAPGLGGWQLFAALAMAEWLIWLIPAGLVLLWFVGAERNRQAAVTAVLSATLALLLNGMLALVWFHTRPFVDGVGHTFLSHAADSSFPSDHATLMLSVGLALTAAHSVASRRIGCVLLALSPLVAWARVFLGVHYPLDMAGALGVAACTTLVMNTPMAQAGCRRVTMVCESVYRQMLSAPIARGWIRS